jgi:hypothetical protein
MVEVKSVVRIDDVNLQETASIAADYIGQYLQAFHRNVFRQLLTDNIVEYLQAFSERHIYNERFNMRLEWSYITNTGQENGFQYITVYSVLCFIETVNRHALNHYPMSLLEEIDAVLDSWDQGHFAEAKLVYSPLWAMTNGKAREVLLFTKWLMQMFSYE